MKWSEDERAKAVLDKYVGYAKNTNKILYWFSLLILLICNLIISVFLIPFLLVLKGWFLWVVISVLGLVFGVMFNFLITNIEHLERKHHVFALVFIPLVAVINILVMVHVSNNIASIIQLQPTLHPLILGSIYALFFLLPYLIGLVRR